MWIYSQDSGDLFHNAIYVETGYSGAKPDGVNNPSKECIRNVGPIPRGFYRVQSPKNTPTQVTLPLSADRPDYCNPPRFGFLFHGDNSNSTASQGCIIVSRRTRERIRDSGDGRLRVVKKSVKSESVYKRYIAKDNEL